MKKECDICNNPLGEKQNRFCSRSCSAYGNLRAKDKGQGKNRTRIVYNGKREYEYRVIYATFHDLILGIDILSTDIIHHKDGNPNNNSIENLELLKGEAAKSHCKKHEIWKHKTHFANDTAGVLEINGKEFWF